MDVLFLGTGAGVPSKGRNVSSIALNLPEERRSVWLFDCGEATQHQILHTAVKPGKIEKIFITHLHGDHIFGLPGLLGSRSFQGGSTELTVYGPPGIREFLETSLSVSKTHLKYNLRIEEIREGVIFEDNTFTVLCRRLEHGIPSYGYRVVEKDLPGTLLVNKLEEAGVQPGPVYQEIKKGNTVQLPDGRFINGSEFVGPPKKGKIIAILGDTRVCKNSAILAQDADLLIHEATFSHEDRQLAFDYFHATSRDAAETALVSNVKALILTHISSRYQGAVSDTLLASARERFPAAYLAEDFSRYIITGDGVRKSDV